MLHVGVAGDGQSQCAGPDLRFLLLHRDEHGVEVGLPDAQADAEADTEAKAYAQAAADAQTAAAKPARLNHIILRAYALNRQKSIYSGD